MTATNIKDDVDLQNFAENVSFLADCFDNSFALESSLKYVKEYITEANNEENKDKVVSFPSKTKVLSQTKNNALGSTLTNKIPTSQISENSIKNKIFLKKIKNWGLPQEIANKYEQRGITEMFDWQVECLANKKVLLECQNLVYSAPTSAGKTLVAEILTIKTVLERQKKVIIILPFVSIVREKMFYLQDILSTSGVRVEGFMGSQSPPGGLQAVHIAICTIEKANSLVNKLIDEGTISELGAVIVDELHLLGDSHRGYILELLLTKIKYVSSKLENMQVQIIGMSATLPNLSILANWLEAELFITEFRPIPLDEYCLVSDKYYDKHGKCIGKIENAKITGIEVDSVLSLCLETIKDGCSILIFCMTKNRCENLAQNISSSFYKLGSSNNELGMVLRNQLKPQNIFEVLEQLKNCPVGLDQVLKNTISFGVAYHHAGLTFDERDIIEGAFKSGAIRVLVATSTLSSGVNLPARKVVIRTPVFQRQPINILTYKQMIGRAGRMGKDTKGESILICTQAEQKMGFELMMGNLDPVKSCIESEDKFMRAVLEMIASQDVCTASELDLYTKCTLLFTQEDIPPSQNFLLQDTLKQLIDFELIRIQPGDTETRYVATSLGKACLSSSMAPNDGLSLFCELQKARQCLVLETDLHLIYLVTPYSVSSQWRDIDWLHLLTLWESLTAAMKRVGNLVGVQESFIICCLRGTNKSCQNQNKLNIHKRFYTALALQDLVNEVPLTEVASKFQCARGFLQGLQQSAATFAGMVTAFCRQLGWKNMEMLISQFQDRLHFGIHSELLELMKLPILNGVRARTLFDAGFETITSIAAADENVIENALYKSAPFQSEKERDGDDDTDVRKCNKIRNIWITGNCAMTPKEAAHNLIFEARKYLAQEIGVAEIKWSDSKSSEIYQTVLDTGQSTSESKQGLENINNEIDMLTSTITKSTNELENTDTNNVLSNKCENTSQIIKEIPLDVNIDSTTRNCSNQNENVEKSITQKDTLNGKLEATQIIKETTDSNAVTDAAAKEDDAWESLCFSNAVFDNISKICTSDNFLSPNISFGESLEFPTTPKDVSNNYATSKNVSSKDISLFSSEGDESSLFEESLPLDLLPDTLINNTNSIKEQKSIKTETTLDFINIHTKSILNAFKSSVIEVDEDEDIKLVYEDEKRTVDSGSNLTQENEVKSTQDFQETLVQKSFISPLKRQSKNKKTTQSLAKKAKRMSAYNNVQINSSESKKLCIKIGAITMNCYVLRGTDIIQNFYLFENANECSFIIETNDLSKTTGSLIGSNIFKTGMSSLKVFKDDKNLNLPIKSITICVTSHLCLYLDLNSSGSFLTSVKLKLIQCLLNKTSTWKMFSAKSIFVCMKKWLGKDLLPYCFDISLAEWLLSSDEKISKFQDLTKKYCDIDLLTVVLNIDNDKKKYSSLETCEISCLKAWCIWAVADKQKRSLEKCQIDNTLWIESQVLKILANCEYHGITVDKDLASQLLIDVKNSQGILQKKAFKLCGYHFNFNSSKDVAKVLGMYKGRKVSTKKSVLSAHHSPMASLVIYWRKLNSILTKTLYPLTEQACIYSAGNRISPTYTMYTCTGRISMHEPNLQNVPRTFSIPFNYLTDETEPCNDVIEFNCRNIFKASPGYVFVSADYCQLEMRILTHYCKDAVLTRIMSSDVDVFKSIAASWSDLPEDQVDDDLRQKAKQLCYGILYGMGNRTLAQHLDVNEMEAAIFMDTFYKTYPAIKIYTQSVLEECRKTGYVETLMKRRRYLPDITSNVASKRSAAERQAVNTTIQGSAADVAKAAMCAIDTRTNDDMNIDKPRLILQMHDELIYEVLVENKSKFLKIIKELMEDTVQLSVPLPVKVKQGYSWGAMEEIKF